jgi:hypothetical protein
MLRFKINMNSCKPFISISTPGKYLIEVWKACGMNMEKVEFIWTSDDIEKHAQSYWEKVRQTLLIKEIMREYRIV